MSFKPLRDHRPLEERPLEVQIEARFHQAVKDYLTKKQQGRVMGELRAVLKELMGEVPQ